MHDLRFVGAAWGIEPRPTQYEISRRRLDANAVMAFVLVRASGSFATSPDRSRGNCPSCAPDAPPRLVLLPLSDGCWPAAKLASAVWASRSARQPQVRLTVPVGTPASNGSGAALQGRPAGRGASALGMT